MPLVGECKACATMSVHPNFNPAEVLLQLPEETRGNTQTQLTVEHLTVC